MNELIKLKTSAGGKKTVSGRELHEFLETKEKFTDWVQRKINDYDFIKGIDYNSFSEKSEKGGRPRTEYEITLEMAKELSMLENNDQGKKARKYFIQCEKELESNAIPINASKELKAIFVLDVKQQALESKVDNLENNMTIDHGQAVNIKHAIDLAVKKLCFGSESPAYRNKELKRTIYQYAWRSLKDYFEITAYHNLLRRDMERALEYIKNLRLQGSTLRLVQITNNQLSMEG